MDENTIRDLLEGELQKTLIEMSKVKADSEASKAEMAKFSQLYDRMVKSEEINCRDRQRIADSDAKDKDFALRKQELELREKEITQRELQFAAEKKLHEAELEIKRAELKGAKTDRAINIGLGVFNIAVPVIGYSYWMAKGLKFEETGTFTSRTGKWIADHLRLFGGKKG